MSRGGPNKEWYEEGLRFECTCCGECCTGPPGFVLFTEEEAEAIAAELGVDVATFYEQYTHETSAGRSLTERETEHGFDCIFLDRESQPGIAVCSIYNTRPLQCRTFPWWPEHLRHPRDWSRLSRYCEGVGRGDFVPIEKIRIERKRHEDRPR